MDGRLRRRKQPEIPPPAGLRARGPTGDIPAAVAEQPLATLCRGDQPAEPGQRRQLEPGARLRSGLVSTARDHCARWGLAATALIGRALQVLIRECAYHTSSRSKAIVF